MVVKFEDNAEVITARPPFNIPSFARVVISFFDSSTASFLVNLKLYIFDISRIIWTFTEVVVMKSTAGNGLTSITPPVIQVYLFITLKALDFLCRLCFYCCYLHEFCPRVVDFFSWKSISILVEVTLQASFSLWSVRRNCGGLCYRSVIGLF